MGKIILTERQYRNLNQILIGKEVENNKGRLNEGYIPSADGMSLTVSSDDYIGVKGSMIKGGAVVKVNGPYELICNQCQYEGSSSEIKVGNFKYNCIGDSFTIDKGYMFVTSDDTIMPGLKKLCEKSKSFDTNWGGSGTDPDKYWNGLFAKLKPYGAKLATSADNKGPFMYWGKNYIMKNYLADSGWNIVLNGLSYKFNPSDYKGKYAGQPLENIVLTPKSGGASEKLLTLIGPSAEVSAGTENPAGTDTNIVLFQRWYWSEKETEDSAPYVSGDKKDKCKAKYKSALCGGKPCIRTQAVDGKKGGNTTKLMTDATIKKEFDAWVKTNPSELADYSKLETCSSAEKGYDKPVVRGGGTGTGGTGGGGTGGGGSPFGGQYSDFF